jgi:hypothetical protein
VGVRMGVGVGVGVTETVPRHWCNVVGITAPRTTTRINPITRTFFISIPSAMLHVWWQLTTILIT